MAQSVEKYFTTFSLNLVYPMKTVTLIKIYLKETYSKVSIGKNMSNALFIQNSLKQGQALTPLLLNFA
jgi:hypothetical protein